MILDLTVRRFRQIVAAIHRRDLLRRREEISLTSWQTRQITTFVAGGYMIDSKKGNPALDMAQTLAFDEIEAAQIEEAKIRSASGGALVYGKDEETGEEKVVEIITSLPSNLQSQESVLNAFGDPSKWRGRG